MSKESGSRGLRVWAQDLKARPRVSAVDSMEKPSIGGTYTILGFPDYQYSIRGPKTLF